MNDLSTPPLDVLLERIRDADTAVRATTVHQIGQRRDPAAIEALVWLMADDSLWVRCNAAEALGEFGVKEAVEPLVQFLRLGTKRELEKVGSPPDLPLRFHKYLREHDPAYDIWIQQQGINAPHEGFSLVISARIGLRMTGIHTTHAMIDLLDAPNPYTQHVAVQVLYHMAMRQHVLNALSPLLTGDNQTLQINAIYALARLGNIHAVDQIVPLLHHPALPIRLAAVDALGIINHKQSVETLKKLLIHDDLREHIELVLMDMETDESDIDE